VKKKKTRLMRFPPGAAADRSDEVVQGDVVVDVSIGVKIILKTFRRCHDCSTNVSLPNGGWPKY
jgi:hypothetical protein